MSNKKLLFDNLKTEIENCKACPLFKTRTNIVFGEGSLNSPLLIIGEAPGATEDSTGKPFVGRAGKFLDSCLKEASLLREDVFIANVMKCRPCILSGKTNKNRPPTKEETDACRKWLKAQIDVLKPKVILSLGAPATRFILNRKTLKMNEIRGTFIEINDMFVMPSLQPSYILTYKGEEEKQMLIKDIKACYEKVHLLGLNFTKGENYTTKAFDLFNN